MNVSNQCHICLEENQKKSKKEICLNINCSGYICNRCWNDIVNHDIKTCPLCRTELNIQVDIIGLIKKKINNFTKYLILILIFYSIGTTSILILLSLKYDINYIKQLIYIIDTNKFLASLLVNPIVGFIIWYIIIIFIYKCISKYEVEVEVEVEVEETIDNVLLNM
jgi:hypothetical protein